MKSIIIIGYMGAGKTTVGKALAKELGVMFYDLDWYIETRMHKTVKEIFDEKGEEGFRFIEHNMLHEVAEFENVVVSCGGGTPWLFDNIGLYEPVGNHRLSEGYSRDSPRPSADGKGRATTAAKQDTRGGGNLHQGTTQTARALLSEGTAHLRHRCNRRLRQDTEYGEKTAPAVGYIKNLGIRLQAEGYNEATN